MKFLRIAVFIAIASINSPLFSMDDQNQKLINAQLISAAQQHDLVGVCHALKNGANVDATDEHGNTALMGACLWLIEAWWLNYDVKAAFKKQRAVVRVLLKFDAALDEENESGETALLIAADSSQEKHKFFNSRLIEILIAAGADTQPLKEKDSDYQEWARDSLIDKYTDKDYRPCYASFYSCFPNEG